MKLTEFRKFQQGVEIQSTRTKLIIPTFDLAVPVWAGASTIIGEYSISNDYFFSLKTPIDAFGDNFIPCIRWVEDSIVFRFKFFDNEKGVLFYPVYNGEVIGLNAVVEIWSINSPDAPALDNNQLLESSVLSFPNQCGSCCQLPDEQQLLELVDITIVNVYAYCNPFELPLLIQ